jgi:hypothetical protein
MLTASCAVRAAAPPDESRLALPAGSVDVIGLDWNQTAALVRRRGRAWVTALRRDTGEVTAQFDLPATTVSIAALDEARILALTSAAPHCELEVFSTGGQRLARFAFNATCPAAATAGGRAYVLFVGNRGRTVSSVDLQRGNIVRSFGAPPRAASLDAFAEGYDASLVVGTTDGALWQRDSGIESWERIATFGSKPVYAKSGNAIYALQRILGDAFVAVIARPFDLQVRLFPVASHTERMTEAAGSSLVVLERTAGSASARIINCRSPLLAVSAYSAKHGKYYDEGHEPDVASTLPPTPEPLATGDQC